MTIISTNSRLLEMLAVPRNETIYGIVGRMRQTIWYMRQFPELKALSPFLQTYFDVTCAVNELQLEQNCKFEDAAAVERLDVEFAALYFRPLTQFLETGQPATPWVEYYKYCNSGGIPFVQLLLGINAHINADLCECIRKLNYQSKADFDLVDSILVDLLSKQLERLAWEHSDIIAAGGLVLQGIFREKFAEVITGWRADAWRNAHTERSLEDVRSKTEQVAQAIIAEFHDFRNYLDIPKFIKKISELGV